MSETIDKSKSVIQKPQETQKPVAKSKSLLFAKQFAKQITTTATSSSSSSCSPSPNRSYSNSSSESENSDSDSTNEHPQKEIIKKENGSPSQNGEQEKQKRSSRKKTYTEIHPDEYEETTIGKLIGADTVNVDPKFLSLQVFIHKKNYYIWWLSVQKLVRRADMSNINITQRLRKLLNNKDYGTDVELQFIDKPHKASAADKKPKGVRIDVVMEWIYEEFMKILVSKTPFEKMSVLALDCHIMFKLICILDKIVSNYQARVYKSNYSMEKVLEFKKKCLSSKTQDKEKEEKVISNTSIPTQTPAVNNTKPKQLKSLEELSTSGVPIKKLEEKFPSVPLKKSKIEAVINSCKSVDNSLKREYQDPLKTYLLGVLGDWDNLNPKHRSDLANCVKEFIQ